MSQWYVPSDYVTLAGVACMLNRRTGESCIFGARGQVWELKPGYLRVLVYGPTPWKRLVNIAIHSSPKPGQSEEAFLDLKKEDIQKILKAIEVPTRRGKQVKFSKDFDNQTYMLIEDILEVS